VTARINRMRGTPGASVWQRNYWEHIVRDDVSLNEIRAYIQNNPARRAEDQLHPDAPPNPFNRLALVEAHDAELHDARAHNRAPLR